MVQCWLWLGDGDSDDGSGLAMRRRSSWTRAQIGVASFGLDLFGWIMFVVVLGSKVV